MLFNDTYKTVAQISEGIFRDKGSKFIAYAFPLNNETELKDILQKLRKEHPKANHFCWAMRLSTDRTVFKLNDDGEPGGTAGRPILNTLLSFDLTNMAIVVIRYFGGTLLGVSGLINAYKSAAVETLNAAKIIEKIICDVYEIHFNYLQMNEVMRIVKEHSLTVVAQIFETDCKLVLAIRKTELNTVLNKLTNVKGLTAKFSHTV